MKGLDKYAEAIARLEKLQFNSISETFEIGGPFTEETWRATEEATCVRKGNRWYYATHQFGQQWYGGKFYSYDGVAEFVIDRNGNRLYFSRDTDDSGRGSVDGLIPRPSMTGYDDYKLGDSQRILEGIAIEQRWNSDFYAGVTLHEDPSDDRFVGSEQQVTRWLFGYLPGDDGLWLPDVMKQAGVELISDDELIDGHRTLELRSKSEFGTHTIWLDPEAGFLPRRIRCHKTGSDRASGRPVNARKPHGDPGRRRPNLPLEAFGYEMADVEISEVEGQPFITRFRARETWTYEGDAIFEKRRHVVLEQVTFAPSDEALELTMYIPNGTKLHVRNAPGIDCEWRDGQIIRRVDNSVISSLADLEFRPEVSNRRKWLLAINVAVIVVILALLLRRRLARRSSYAA